MIYLFPMVFNFFLEQLWYLCFLLIFQFPFITYHSYIKLSNDFLSNYTHHSFLYMTHPFVFLPATIFPNKLALNVPNNIKKTILFDFASFYIAFTFMNNHDSLTVCSYHVTYAFQNESTLYSCLNVKKLFLRSRREIWSLSECNAPWTHNHLVSKQTQNHLVK